MNFSYIYQKTKKEYLKFLPNSPIFSLTKKIGIEKKLFEYRFKKDVKKFPYEIQKEIIEIKKETGDFLLNKDFKNLGDIFQHLLVTKELDGDIIEFGTYKGQTTVFIAKALEKIGVKKKIFTCDTFEGIPYEDKFSTNEKAKGSFSDTSLETVKKTYQKFDVSKKIEIIKGKFEDVVKQQLDNKKFSYIFVDCDVYDASVFALNFGFSRLENKGIMSFDDYERDQRMKARWGMTKAVDDFCNKNKIKLFSDTLNYLKLPYIKKS